MPKYAISNQETDYLDLNGLRARQLDGDDSSPLENGSSPPVVICPGSWIPDADTMEFSVATAASTSTPPARDGTSPHEFFRFDDMAPVPEDVTDAKALSVLWAVLISFVILASPVYPSAPPSLGCDATFWRSWFFSAKPYRFSRHRFLDI
jgi:hypothetical protein